MQRREVLVGGATAAAAGLFCNRAQAADAPPDLIAALERFRASIPSNFDRTYVENAVVPFFLTSVYEGERRALPDDRLSHLRRRTRCLSISGG